MKFTRLWIDGYGRFSGRELSVAPGLQVIAGANERGKSTIRGFICEMLYGQKRSTSQRIYEPTHELRIPWNRSAVYGGRVEYVLDDGTVIEIQRNFDRDQEFVKVFDRSSAEDITMEFPTLRNRENTFAECHLGMSRSVFLGVATISHASLADLGDDAALAQIREKLVSMTDSGEADHSSDAALKWLNARVGAIGQKTARKRPLPLARARLVDLQKEFAEIRLARADAAQLENERVESLERLAELTQARAETESRLAAVEQRVRAERLRKAELISARIDEITKACFALGDVRDFPVEDLDAVREIAPRIEAAERQVASLEQERANLEEKLETERRKLGEGDAPPMEEIDPANEERLVELDSQIRSMNDRVEELRKGVSLLEKNQEDCRARIDAMPDFSRLSADPVELLTQFVSSISVAMKTRTAETEQRDRLRAAVAAKEAEVRVPREAFGGCSDFPALARQYLDAASRKSETLIRLERETELLHGAVDDLESRIPELILYTTGCAIFMILTLVVWYNIPNNGIFIATALLAGLAVFVGSMAFQSRRRIRSTLERLDEIEDEERRVASQEAEGRQAVDEIMQRIGCQSVRELEAAYDRFRQDLLELELLQRRLDEQETRAGDSEQRVDAFLERLKTSLHSIGYELDSEADFEGAAMRAISRYQELRDAKRRSNDIRDQLKLRQEELAASEERLEDWRQKERDLGLQVRQFMRDNHYPEEANIDSALAALRGYRMRSAQVRQRRGQVDACIDRISMLDARLPEERSRLAALRTELETLMARADAQDLASYKEAAERAAKFRDLRKELAGLEEQLVAVLDGQDLNRLRAIVGAESGVIEQDASSTDELKAMLQQIKEEVDSVQKREHALHLAVTERLAGLRSINEVEEERDAVAHQLQELEMELQACTYAMSILEEVTRERHARIAPRLAQRASEYLAEITDGAYGELLINRDLAVRIRLPETKALHDRPEQALSKGTVDQIYLALRLAMVESLSSGAESVPMLLDDPFANYDDLRLDRAMRLLQRVSQRHQILFFTCREDVVGAAEAAGAPVIQL